MGNLVSERSLLDYLYVLVKWRRLIAVSFVAVGLLAAGVSLVLPEKWTANTKLLPPAEEGDQLGLSMLLGSAVPAGLSGLVGATTPSDRLLTLLDSRHVLGAVVDSHDLMTLYDAPYRDLAIDMLNDRIDRRVEADGTLVIDVTASTPELAARLANDLASELDEVNRYYKRQQAKSLRAFLGERVQLMQAELKDRAGALQAFQEEHGLVNLEAQILATVEVVEAMVMRLLDLETSLGQMTRQVTAGRANRDLLIMQVEELRKQIRKATGEAIEQDDDGGESSLRSLGPSLKSLPALMFQHAELTLDVKVREEIVRYLGTKLEEAKYREALNTPTLQILDPATPPKTRSAPRRTLIVLSASVVSLVMSVVLAFLFESWNRVVRENEDGIASIRQLLHRRD
jgi:uncharacterized protein involved in exopolysaccharide biosynthesis